MNTQHRLHAVLAAALVAAAGCEISAAVDPYEDTQVVALEDQVALQVLENPLTIDAALALAETNTHAAAHHGMGHGQQQVANQLTNEARLRFEAAVNALNEGERVRAAEEAREARRLIARAMEMANGPHGFSSLVEQAEELVTDVAQNPGAFTDANGLQYELHQFALRARHRLQQGDGPGAGELGVLSQQRHQHRARWSQGEGVALDDRAELGVGLAQAAVALATDLLAEGEPNDEQLQYLEAAEEFLAEALTALEAEDFAEAIYLAQHAQWAALKAVVLPGDGNQDEGAAMLALALELYAEAEAAVAADPSELRIELLARALLLIEAGQTQMADENHCGIGAFWHAAVICTCLIGI
jgi:HEPN domain-containing protein